MKSTSSFLTSIINKIIAIESKDKRIQYVTIYAILGIIGIVMVILNATKDIDFIFWVTCTFTLACFLNVGLTFINKVFLQIAKFLFILELTAMFITFIVTGSPDGFSVVWIALLPCFGLLLYGIKLGSVFSIFMWLVLVFFFYVPYGRTLLLFEYNTTFMIRFPIVYIAFYLLALFFEVIRSTTHTKLLEARNKYEYLSKHDNLTDVYNRNGFYQKIDEIFNKEELNIGLLMVDIDNFKSINDTYGHRFGDVAIKETADIIKEIFTPIGVFCRWGGEEFVIVLNKEAGTKEVAEYLLKKVEKHEFALDHKTTHLTVSCGAVSIINRRGASYDKALQQADDNLYKAKANGKNQLVYSEYQD